jgi:hypothetical protein
MQDFFLCKKPGIVLFVLRNLQNPILIKPLICLMNFHLINVWLAIGTSTKP